MAVLFPLNSYLSHGSQGILGVFHPKITGEFGKGRKNVLVVLFGITDSAIERPLKEVSWYYADAVEAVILDLRQGKEVMYTRTYLGNPEHKWPASVMKQRLLNFTYSTRIGDLGLTDQAIGEIGVAYNKSEKEYRAALEKYILPGMLLISQDN